LLVHFAEQQMQQLQPRGVVVDLERSVGHSDPHVTPRQEELELEA
jgi:hypothetical protein